MKRQAFLCGVMLIFGLLLIGSSEAGNVSGKISNGTFPATISVTVNKQHYRTQTKADGAYSIFLPAGTHDLKVNGIRCGKIRSYDVPVRQQIKCP